MYIGKTFEETGYSQMATTQCGAEATAVTPTVVSFHSLTGSCITPVTPITQNTITENTTITTYNV